MISLISGMEKNAFFLVSTGIWTERRWLITLAVCEWVLHNIAISLYAVPDLVINFISEEIKWSCSPTEPENLNGSFPVLLIFVKRFFSFLSLFFLMTWLESSKIGFVDLKFSSSAINL